MISGGAGVVGSSVPAVSAVSHSTAVTALTDSNLSLAQQALAAFEAGGGLEGVEFGTRCFCGYFRVKLFKCRS